MAQAAFAARPPAKESPGDGPAPATEIRHDALERRGAAAAEREQARLLNGRAPGPQPAQRAAAPNRTGLPDRLKSGIEALSGVSLDGVKVHYDSPKPAQLNAHAFAQGTDIHLAPGQDKHLPHEAWHVVQQAQGRVRPTLQLKDGVPVNDDAGLEHEADVMGGKAAAASHLLPAAQLPAGHAGPGPAATQLRRNASGTRGLAGMLLDAQRGGAAFSDDRATAPVAQFNGKAKQLIDDNMKDYFACDGDFIWVNGETNQSRKMCHAHLFKVEKDKITGQLTIRCKESDAGGPAIESAKLSDEAIKAAIIEKFGNDLPGKANRDSVFSGLRSLMDELIDAWTAWKDKD